MGGLIEFNKISLRIYNENTVRGLFENRTTELFCFITTIASLASFVDDLFFYFIGILHYKFFYRNE